MSNGVRDLLGPDDWEDGLMSVSRILVKERPSTLNAHSIFKSHSSLSKLRL
jgi:hypothetical protein